MILKIYSIWDQKGEIFNTPFYQRTHGEAERSFKQVVNDEKSNLCRYPEDYDLYYLGEYDDQTGKMMPKETPQHMIKATQLKGEKHLEKLN